MSNPAATARSGYELRFLDIGTNLYKVTLVRWSAGVQTVLATEASYALPVGSSLALTDQGSTVTAWTDTASGFVELIGATNSEFSGGRAGVEGSGNITRLKNFRFGVPGGSGGGGSAMDTALQNLTLKDAFSTAENPLSAGGNWAALQWDTSTSGHNTGQVSGGWGPYDAFSTVNGAYWHESFADSGTGDAVTATMTYGPRVIERYFSLWLNATSPGTVKSGYELRFYESAAGTYTVTIARWSSGTKTVLATQTGFAFSAGGRFALVEKAKTVSAWTAPAGGEFTQLLSATDTTYASGRPAVEASGNGTRMTNLRAGVLPAL